MELVNYIGVDNVMRFLLLFARLSGLVAFFPFYGHMKIPVVIKTAVVLVFTLIMFPDAVVMSFTPSALSLTLAIVSELMLGFMAGLMLYLVFAMLELAGMQISFVMGFTMANVMDPQTGKNSPLLSQFLTLTALTIFLTYDGHHMILLLYYKSLDTLPLGSFYPEISMWQYISKGVVNLFVFGFILSFPIKALSLLADIIFGMLMKTMPTFNLLVVGFPIKIMISFVVMIATFGVIMEVYKVRILEVLQEMFMVFFA